jgi:hypothetical protein
LELSFDWNNWNKASTAFIYWQGIHVLNVT